MRTLKHRVDWVLGWLLALLMAAAVLNVLWQILARFVSDFAVRFDADVRLPSSFTLEMARFLLIWIGMLGAAYAVGSRSHLAIDLLVTRLSGRWRTAIEVFIAACVLLFAVGVLGIGGLRFVQNQLGSPSPQTSPALGVKMGYVYAVAPISGLVMMFYAVVILAECFRPSSVNDASGQSPEDGGGASPD